MAAMKPTLIALLALCLCLPLVSAEREQILDLKVKAAIGDAHAQWALVSLFQSKERKGEKDNPQDYDEAIRRDPGDEWVIESRKILLDQMNR